MSVPKTKTIFLFIYDQGGYWTCNELAEIFEVPASERHVLPTRLQQMARCKSLDKRTSEATADKRKNAAEYGVTHDCVFPKGVSIKEAQQ